MKKSTFLATAIFAGAFAQPAFAQDAEPRFFDGFYVGGSFGLDAIDDENGEGITFDTDGDGEYGDGVITTTGANAFSPGYCNGAANGAEASDGCSDDKSRYGYGIRIGFDQRIGNGPVVAGLLVEGALSESEDYSTGFSTTPASYTFVRGLDKSVAVRGRLGVSPGSGRRLRHNLLRPGGDTGVDAVAASVCLHFHGCHDKAGAAAAHILRRRAPCPLRHVLLDAHIWRSDPSGAVPAAATDWCL